MRISDWSSDVCSSDLSMSKTTHIIEHDVHTIIEEEDGEEVGARTGKRRRLFTALAANVAVLGGGSYDYDVLVASQHVETDNRSKEHTPELQSLLRNTNAVL